MFFCPISAVRYINLRVANYLQTKLFLTVLLGVSLEYKLLIDN
jgi:hypothetical protein